MVDEPHLTCEEGVALGADIDSHGISGGASLESGTAGAGDSDLVVLWVNTGFHKGNFITKCLFCAIFCTEDTISYDEDGEDGGSGRRLSQEEIGGGDGDHSIEVGEEVGFRNFNLTLGVEI